MNQTYYDEKLETLPENLQYAVIMSDWKKHLIEIQNQFKLHIDQTQVLEDSVIKLMFGDIDAPDFITNMFTNGHINSETAADILLEVDLKILKTIRERLEKMEEQEKKDAELEELLMDDEERVEKEESERYANFYGEVEKINKEVEEEMIKEGIKPDGSNITDEMLGIKTEIPSDINKERADMLKEIESPNKTPARPVELKDLTPNKIEFTPTTKKEEEMIPVDHQLQNTEIEKPYHEEDIIPETKTTTTQSIVKEETPQPKKPININLNDIYREPIE